MPRRRSSRAPLVAVAAAFAVTRLAAYAAGVRFDARKLTDGTQLADVDLLHHHLAETVWWLHGQPPLYNLFLGVVLKVGGSHAAGLFQALQLALGLAGALLLALLLERIGLRPWLAAALAAVAAATPPALLYEAMLFYDQWSVVALTAALLLFVVLLERPTAGRALGFFAVCALLVLTRTVFHPLWLVVVLGLALAAAWPQRRAILVGAALPVALVALVVGKNAVQFGVPGTSSWLGVGLARLVLHDVPHADLEQLAARGRVGRVALVRPFSPLASYRDLVPPHRPTGHAVLDEEWKRGGNPNWFNLDAVAISRDYLHADEQLVRARPGDVAVSVKRAFEFFFQPESASGALNDNRAALGAWDRTFSLVVLGSTPYGNRVGFFAAAAFLLAFAWGAAAVVTALRGRATRETWLLVFAWTLVLLLGVGANLAESGENYRFRLVLDPVLLVVVVLAARRVAGYTRGRFLHSRA
jgi:hypothetical protein